MKKMFLALMLLVSFVPASLAQEKSATDYRNEGNEALKSKNFQAALESYKQAIALWGDSADAITVYAAADCAKRISENETAIEYFNKSIAANYKADMAKYNIAEIYGKQGKKEERIAYLEEMLPTCQDAKVVSFMTKGLTKEYIAKANAAFSEGNKILGECATAKPEQYDAIKARAAEKYNEAKPWLDKTTALDPENPNAKKIKSAIDAALK